MNLQSYLRSQVKRDDSIGALVQDILEDGQWPGGVNNPQWLYWYLEDRGASAPTLSVFCQAVREFAESTDNDSLKMFGSVVLNKFSESGDYNPKTYMRYLRKFHPERHLQALAIQNRLKRSRMEVRQLDLGSVTEKRVKQVEWVYIYRSHDLVKIGKTNDMERRHRELKTGNPYLDLVHKFESTNAALLEKSLHGLLNPYRHKNEWFRLSPQMLNNIIVLVEEINRSDG